MSVTGKPYFPPIGYLIIKPVSPVIFHTVEEKTVSGYIEGVLYFPRPRGPMIRKQEETTA